MNRLWIVQARANGEREFTAIEQKQLIPGFSEVGD